MAMGLNACLIDHGQNVQLAPEVLFVPLQALLNASIGTVELDGFPFFDGSNLFILRHRVGTLA